MKKAFIPLLLTNLLIGSRVHAISVASSSGEVFDPVAIILMIVIVGLAIVILVLGNAVLGAMDVYRERIKKEGQKLLTAGGLIGLTFPPAPIPGKPAALVVAPPI